MSQFRAIGILVKKIVEFKSIPKRSSINMTHLKLGKAEEKHFPWHEAIIIIIIIRHSLCDCRHAIIFNLNEKLHL